MNWLRDLSKVEYAFMVIFGVLYLIYAIKMYTLSRKLQIRPYRLLLKFILRVSYLSLFIVALLGPSFGDIKKEVKAIAREIYFVVDLSYSMDAQDVAPSRIEKTKREIQTVVSALSSDKLGLIAFSSECQWICPPTFDKEAFLNYVRTLSTKSMQSHGSNIPSIGNCIFRESENKDQSRIVVIFSDGENFGKDPSSVFNKMREKGIYTFIVGVGTEKEVKIPESERSWRKSIQGKDYTTLFNGSNLKDMSELASGRYFEIGESSGDIPLLISKINKVEGQLQASRKIDSIANKYYYFLFVGISLLIVDILITVNAVKF